MEVHEAIELIRPAVTTPGGTWADFGAGNGTFTRAVAELIGAAGRVLAVDRNPRALSALRRLQQEFAPASAVIQPVEADVRDVDEVPELAGLDFDGVILGNVLHFLPDAADVLARVTAHVRPGARVVVIEYDGVSSSRWVPFPIPVARFFALANAAGLMNAEVIGERRSAFRGTLYCAAATRPQTAGAES
jgi:ubiquinone/menaquinone biosynthesis C-methylase UbiE